MASQRRFVRDASHELRNPLAVMRTSLDLALEDSDTPSSAWRTVGAGMRETVDRMAAVVDSLLRAARDELPAGHSGSLDPAAVLRSLSVQVEPVASSRQIAVEVEAEARAVLGDRAAIERAVANLVDNALRYAPTASAVRLTGRAAAETYEIRVHDAGPGIAPAEVEAVFERGHRSPGSTGLGLGLAIARDIVRSHEGTIAVERTGPDGTTMLVTLPLGAVTAS
jgi:signal transduction histidine kinase